MRRRYKVGKILLLLMIITVGLKAQPVNDEFDDAIDVDYLKGTCSSDAAFTSLGAYSDLNQASAWNNNDSLHNVWFVFTAPENGAATFTIDIGSGKGDQTRTLAAIWQSDGTSEINSQRYSVNNNDVVIGADSLTPGGTYYLSVDAFNTARTGSFTLCFDSILDYDFISAAIDIDTLKGTCSNDAEYTTIGASGDGVSGDCWNNSGPKVNRWFKFTAPTTQTVSIKVDIDGTKGTQRRSQAAFWESDGVTQVLCSRYGSNADDIEINSISLVAGDTYYLSVDAYGFSHDGTFSLCFDTTATYDFYAGAIDIDTLKGTCSQDAEYSTVGASGDGIIGDCWNNSGPIHNRWFKFTAPTTQTVDITVDIDGTKGDQTRTQLALWDGNGSTQLACSRYDANNDDVSVGSISLTAGDTYYVSVDVQGTSRCGTFTLCFDTTATYDFYSGAIDIDTLKGTCSSPAEYSTVSASPDLNAGDCWNNAGPLYNRWFKFTAPSTQTVNIKVDVGDVNGNQRRTQAAIWESNGIDQVACGRYSNDADDVEVSSISLTAGDTYYLSVDVQAANRVGSFTLCFDTTANYDYFSKAIDIDTLKGDCSADAEYSTIGASPDGLAGDCWNNSGPLYNRWFKFTAPNTQNVNITVDINDGKGDQVRTQAAIWESNGTDLVACNRYSNNTDDVEVSSEDLVAGNTYYLSVDVQSIARAGTFSLCFDTTANYDYYSAAIDIDTLKGGCSSDAEYTTIGASGDGVIGDCWNNGGPIHNRWFKFTAPENGLANLTIDINDGKGDQSRTQAAIWESNGSTMVSCSRYNENNDDVIVSSDLLTPGSTYYLSVDVQVTSRAGSFTLCFDTIPSYDYYVGAIDVDTLLGGCSDDAEYTTSGASGDGSIGDCWNNSGPLYNRWFKFKAPASETVNITIDIGDTKGTQVRTQAALWESNGTDQIACARYSAAGDDIELNSDSLTAGNTYYISVDVQSLSRVGTFTLCIDTTPSYDFYDGALDVTSSIGGCSSDAEYTTVGATGDKNSGDCWNNGGPLFNRWFKFTAPSNGIINVTVDIDGTKGTQRRTQLALWEDGGLSQVACARYSGTLDDVVINETGLTAGDIYYISVDALNANNDGSFTLCLDSNPDYDYYEGAIELTDLNNWCSEDAEYTTIGATGDLNAGGCWNNVGPLYNRWFKFTAISADLTVTVDIENEKGTQRRSQLALWEENGTTPVDCDVYASEFDDVSITSSSLTPGDTYYISVDALNSNNDGSFTLCVSNVSGTYYSRQDGDWNSTATWSGTGHGDGEAGTIPGPGDVVYLDGSIVTISGTDSAAAIEINVDNASTGIIVDNGTLEVLGAIEITSSTDNYGGIEVINNGTLNTNSNIVYTRTGGNEVLELDIESGASVNIRGDLEINSSAGTVNNNTIDVAGSITIANSLKLTQTASGIKTKVTVNGTGELVVADITFSATADDKVEIELNNSSTLDITGGFTRGTPAYGILDANNSATVAFLGSSNQVIPTITGSGTGDDFSFENIIINNSFSGLPQLTMEGDLDFGGDFAFTNGVLSTEGYDFTVNYLSTISGGNSGSYLDGKMIRTGNSDFTFHVGSGAYWAPVDLEGYTGFIDEVFEVEYFASGYSDTTTAGDEIVYISTAEYWDIEHSNGSGSVDVTLHWKDSARSGVDEPTDLAVGHYDGTDWESFGLSNSSAGAAGSITASGVSDFSPFTFGFKKAPVALPVELIDFKGAIVDGAVLLEWSTATELNNKQFELERSSDGVTFDLIHIEYGQGNSLDLTEYEYRDEHSTDGVVYYRLKQVDFDGSYTYSKIIVVVTEGNTQEGGLDIYPNPNAGNTLYIKSDINFGPNPKLQLVNTNGKTIESADSPFISNALYSSYVLSNKIVPGIYYLRLSGNGNQVFQKVVFN